MLLRLIRPMIESPGCTAACAMLPRLAAGPWLSRFASLEALRAWLVRCAAFTAWEVLVPVRGAALMLEREKTIEAGGFRGGTSDLWLRMRRLAEESGKPWRPAFVPAPVSWRVLPQTREEMRRRTLGEQRELAGLIRSHWSAGGRAMPALLAMRFVRPLVETAAYLLALAGLLLGWIDPALAALVALVTIGSGMLISMAGVIFWDLARETGTDPAILVGLFTAAIPENLGYRQVRNLWLIAGFLRPGAR
jgi:hypothetical protein